MSPMAVFSIGLQLRLGSIGKEWRQVSTALLYKLLLAPLLILAIAMIVGEKGNAAQVSVFEASMSSHITVSLLASQNGLNPRLCSLIESAPLFADCWRWHYFRLYNCSTLGVDNRRFFVDFGTI